MPANKKVLLLGTHGQYNWGDEILLETFLYNLGIKHSYFVNSYDPQDTLAKNKQYKIEAFHTTKDVYKLPGYILKSDLVFFGGGSILKELYKSVGRNKYSTLIMIFGMVFFAKYFGRKKIVMSNIGIGVIETKFGKSMVRRILNMVDMVYFRDRESYHKAVDFGVKKPKMGVVPDVVFSRSRSSLGLNEDYQKQDNKNLKIALNLNFDIANRDNWNYFLENLAIVLKEKTKKFNIQWLGLPMQTDFNPNHDIKVLTDFANQNPELNLEVVNPKTSQELYQIIDACDVVIAERLHSLILSAVIGKPVFALDYDIKVKSLCKYLGIEDFAIDINTKFDKNELDAKLENLLKDINRAKIKLDKIVKDIHLETQEYISNLKKQLDID